MRGGVALDVPPGCAAAAGGRRSGLADQPARDSLTATRWSSRGERASRPWLALGAACVSAFVITLDSTVLNVAIPTILRDFHTTLPTLQWVLTGYALMFAALLVIGGRLGDMYGHRSVFVVGCGLFFCGSLLAVISWSAGSLIAGEAVIEGMGASLMMPATLAIISTTFAGERRAAAFAVWGATVGVATALGPVVGGILTSELSWRWAFGVNLVCIPLAVVAALASVPRPATRRSVRLDLSGAALVSGAMFLLVFAVSQAGRQGWWAPLRAVSLDGTELWPSSAPVSMVPALLVLAALLLGAFVVVERSKERHRQDPLFEFGQLRHRAFRYGILISPIIGMTQLGLLFALPVFLQQTLGLSALATGIWLVPLGATIALSAPLGARLTRRIHTTGVVRLGMVLQCVGLVATAAVIRPALSFAELLPGMVVVGVGLGLATSQLTNVILADIRDEHAGVASGVNATVRQAGVAIGIALIGALLSTSGAQTAVFVLAGIGLVGSLLSLLLPAAPRAGSAVDRST